MSDRIVQEMLQKAKAAMKHAYNPYSNFFVGACILADDGKLYAGCNVENVSYSLTLCAEASALGAMVSAGAKRIKKMVVVAESDKIIVPCGACRQRSALGNRRSPSSATVQPWRIAVSTSCKGWRSRM